MKLWISLWLVPSFAVLFSSSSLPQRSESNIETSGLPEHGLHFLQVESPRTAPKIVDLVEEKGVYWSRLEPYLLVLWNQTPRRITGLSVAWTIMDSSGLRVRYQSNARHYLDPQLQVVLGAYSQAILMPSGFVDIQSVGRGGRLPHASHSDEVKELRSARVIQVSIDSVLFEDGETLGPDRSRLAENIRSRNQAISVLAENWRQSAMRGQALSSLLDSFASEATWNPTAGLWEKQMEASVNQADLLRFWTAEIALEVLNAPSSTAMIRLLQSLPRAAITSGGKRD